MCACGRVCALVLHAVASDTQARHYPEFGFTDCFNWKA
eukprot:COSAG01_NODE_57719_length_310_cov_1.208531_1_plen_37_part_10